MLAALLCGVVLSAGQQKSTWTAPYTIVEEAPERAVVEHHLKKAKSAVWLDGNVLSFAYRSSADIVRLTGTLQKPMTRLGESDLWVLRLEMEGWQECLVPYSFFTSDGKSEAMVWRGASAPLPLVKAEKLQGAVVEKTLHSEALGEERKLTVYIPPNAPKGLPALFMADGQSCKGFAEVLEPLILAGKVRPVALIGINNAGDLRAKEYVPGADPDRFAKHMRFVFDEVTAWATKELWVSSKREDRALFGYSDGGSFTATAVTLRPEVFGKAMPLSPGVPIRDGKPSGALPDFYFGAGKLEAFSVPTGRCLTTVSEFGAKAKMRTYFGGHEGNTWLFAFADFVPLMFPGASLRSAP